MAVGLTVMFASSHIINKQTSADANVMVLLRKCMLTCLRYNVNFTFRYETGRDTILADKLSRCQIKHVRTLAPWVNCEPASLGTL